MHIDRPHQIAVSIEPTGFAGPVPVARLMLMPTLGTLATCSSFRASEALDVSVFAFVGEVVDVTPILILPKAHALVVVASVLTISHSMGIANEEGPNLLLHAEVDHFAG
jgi:hypothetical protein